MKIFIKAFAIAFILLAFVPLELTKASNSIKVLDIQTNEVINETEASSEVDDEIISALNTIKRVTVQANPIPNRGYLIKIPLTKSLNVKNEWFNDIISEVLVVYNPYTNQNRLIVYNDENTPIFFDIDYTFPLLKKKLNLHGE